MKWVLCLFLLTAAVCNADIACMPRTMESITYHSQSGQTIALIKLSDGSVWKWSPDFYSENLLRKWQDGDEILVQANCHPGLTLMNRQRPHYRPQVALTFNSYLLFPSLDSVDGETIYLSDGSVWEYLYDFNKRTLRHWALEDRIIPVRGAGENFQLINIDIPYDNRGQIERFIEVLPKTAECKPLFGDEIQSP